MTRLFLVVPFRVLVIVFGLFALLVLAGGAVLVSALDNPTLWVLPILTDGVLLLIAVPLGILVNRPYLSDIDRMLGGRAWAHWTYDEAGWRAANRLEVRREWRGARWPGILLPLIGAAFAVYGLGSRQPAFTGVGAFLAGCGLAVVAAIVLGSSTLPARVRSRGELFITPVGVYRRPGGYTPLVGVSQTLRAVTFVPDGDVHYLRFDVARRSRYGTTVSEGARVLVTASHIDEARLLVEQFNTAILNS